jgi:hypothetical protein
VLAGVVGGHDDAADARLADRVGAGRSATLVAARLERDVQRGVVQVPAGRGVDRLDLGVRAADGLMKALGDRLPIAADHRSDERVGADVSASMLSQLDRACEVPAIDFTIKGHRWPALEDIAGVAGRPRAGLGGAENRPPAPGELAYRQAC